MTLRSMRLGVRYDIFRPGDRVFYKKAPPEDGWFKVTLEPQEGSTLKETIQFRATHFTVTEAYADEIRLEVESREEGINCAWWAKAASFQKL